MLSKLSQKVLEHGNGWSLLLLSSPFGVKSLDSDAAACKPLTTSSKAAPDSAGQCNGTTQQDAHFPPELLEVIIPLACGFEGSTSAPHVDTKAAARIALVSKELYSYALPLLYTYVILSKPSQVILYARTTLDRPDLARMTKTLWIGPNIDTLLSPFWWPLNASRTAMRSSLTDPGELPRGVAVGQWWSVVMDTKESGHHKNACAAVAELIICAWQQLDANMEGPKGHKATSFVPEALRRSSTSEWRLKAFQVQRILDGYLKAWRRRQDTTLLALRYGSEAEQAIGSEMSRGACSDNGDWPDPKAWVVNEIGNTGTIQRDPCDLFDHPMIYERSKWGQIFEDAIEARKFVWSPGDSSHRRHRSKPGVLASDKTARSLLSQILISKPTVSDVVEACKIVIVRLPQLRALAFTGYPVATLSDALPAVQQANLKQVILGPTSQFVPLRLAQGQQLWSNVQIVSLSDHRSVTRVTHPSANFWPGAKTIRWRYWTPQANGTRGADFNIGSAFRHCFTDIRLGQILVSTDPGDPPAALLDNPNFRVGQLRERAAADHPKLSFPGFLRSQAYNAQAFAMVQSLWNSVVGYTLLEDPQLFRPYVFSGKDEDGR